MGEPQGLQQQGPGRRGKAQEEQVGDLIETRVQTQVRGPAPEKGAGGAVLDGEGLDLQGIVRLGSRQGRGGVPGMHENQALDWARPALPPPSALAGPLPGAFEQPGDEDRGIGWISQDQDGSSGRVKHRRIQRDSGSGHVWRRQTQPVEAPRPVAFLTQSDDHLVRQEIPAQDQDGAAPDIQ